MPVAAVEPVCLVGTHRHYTGRTAINVCAKHHRRFVLLSVFGCSMLRVFRYVSPFSAGCC